MSKSVVINLGSGDYQSGFPRVTAQIWVEGHVLPEQFIGSLPPAPFLIELYKNWQSMYQYLYENQQLRSSVLKEHSQEIEIEFGDITNVSVVSFDELSEELQVGINEWLSSREFLHIDQQLRSRLTTAEEIRVIIETGDIALRRLPWHCWNLFADFPKAEMALSRQEYKRTLVNPAKDQARKVRILGILSSSSGIDFERESKFLNSLADTQTVFLVNPSRQELNTQLWNSDGWDILFFAGHSQTESEIGRIYINENPTNNNLTIEELNQALLAAIGNGLRLAIFNSCDGLGLAVALEKLNIPTVIVMREPVPNRVAQDFFQYFLEAFATHRLSLYLAVQQARRKLQGVESEFPGASWLPVICQNPSVEAPTWLTLGGMPPCPYRGLFTFGEEDAHLYFGREKFIQDLLLAVKTKPLVTVLGASGSGKSSVVFAGLIPALLSLSLRDNERKKHNRRRRLTVLGLAGGLVFAMSLALIAWWQAHKAHESDIQTISESSAELFVSNQKLDALIKAIQAKQKLQNLGRVSAQGNTLAANKWGQNRQTLERVGESACPSDYP